MFRPRPKIYKTKRKKLKVARKPTNQLHYNIFFRIQVISSLIHTQGYMGRNPLAISIMGNLEVNGW